MPSSNHFPILSFTTGYGTYLPLLSLKTPGLQKPPCTDVFSYAIITKQGIQRLYQRLTGRKIHFINAVVYNLSQINKGQPSKKLMFSPLLSLNAEGL